MAKKPFYSQDEVTAKLGKSADEIKALVRDGTLREFRDAGKVFYKADDVDKLAAASAPPGDDTGEILLDAATDLESIGTREGSGDVPAIEDTSGGTSLIGLEPLADEEEEKGKKKEDTVITASGIGVFDDDELEIDADPMAKTQITSGAMADQVSLEGAGSGSGLLDLAREADDTALGADLLDEIYPGEEESAEAPRKAAAPPPPQQAAEAAEEPEEQAELAAVDTGEVVAPVIVATGDPFEGMFSGLLVAGLVLMALSCTIVAAVLRGFMLPLGELLGDGKYFLFFLGGAVVFTGITLAAGWFLGKAFATRRR